MKKIKTQKSRKMIQQYSRIVPPAIWKCRNKACFDSKLIKHPAEISYHACSFMMYWAGLYPPEMQGKILEGVKALLACVHRAVVTQPSHTPRILPAVTVEDNEEAEVDG